MNKIVKNALVEIVRIIVTAVLAAIGVAESGCIASGNGANAAFTVSTTNGGVK